MTPARSPQGLSTRGCNGPHPHFVRIVADEPQGRYTDSIACSKSEAW